MKVDPKRGEIWQANLDPTIGGEIQKPRPVVVINSDLFTTHDVRIIIPITEWQERYSQHLFMVKIPKSRSNGLDKDSIGNTLQIRSISILRFEYRRGIIEENILKNLLSALTIAVDYFCE